MIEISQHNEKSLKILQVVSTPPFAWATGGCARVVYDLSKELAKMGHSVTILTTDMYEPKKRYKFNNNEFIEGVEIIRYKYYSEVLAWKYKIYISLGMISYLKNHVSDYDVVHLQDLLSFQGIMTSIYCKRHNIPYILTAHGSLPFLMKNKILNKLLFQRIVSDAQNLTALTNDEFNLFKKIGVDGNKITIIPNGVDFKNNTIEKGLFRHKYKIGNNLKIILYLGRIHKTKGLDTLVNVFYRLLKCNEETILVIAGPDDGFLQKIQKLTNKLKITDKVLIPGPLYGKEKFEAYLDSDVFVTPKFSGFPLTFLESCSCDTPIITTNANDSADWIDDNVGYVVDYSEKNLFNAIKRVLTNDSVQNKFKSNYKRTILKFTWACIAKKYEKLYIDTLSD